MSESDTRALAYRRASRLAAAFVAVLILVILVRPLVEHALAGGSWVGDRLLWFALAGLLFLVFALSPRPIGGESRSTAVALILLPHVGFVLLWMSNDLDLRFNLFGWAFAFVMAQIVLGARAVTIWRFGGVRSVPDAASMGSAPFWGLVFALAGPAGFMVIGSFLVNPHPPNRFSAAVSELRGLVSAELVYQSASGGGFGVPDCLVDPPSCLTEYPAEMATMLDAEQAAALRGGYARSFHPLPDAGASSRQPDDGITRFVFLAVPLEPQAMQWRSLCADHTGRVCVFPADIAPGAGPDGCPRLCDDL